MAVVVSAVVLGVALILAARSLAGGLQAHGEALVGYWGTKPSETVSVDVEEIVARWNLDHPEGGEMVLESELDSDGVLGGSLPG